ncbi:MAG: VWA domain-containing protein [Phycisphaeraceae bacterium]
MTFALFGIDIINYAGFWLLLLIPPLVLLYFLKLKRPRLAVPSLVLWQQVVNDNRVNSPFQRFKRNILLLLQLILLILLIIAALEPYRKGGVSSSDRLPILIDRSASMGAKDDKGVSRLEIAKREARDLINSLAVDEEVAIIAFGKTAQQVQDFTSNKRLLLDAVDAIEIEDVPSDLSDGMRLADAMWRTERFDRALLISDGNFPEQIDFELPFKLDYQQLAPAGVNMGITALNARRGSEGAWSIFINVSASKDNTGSAELELIQDGESRATQVLSPGPGQGQRVSFSIGASKATSLELRLKVNGFDALESDNVAYLELSPQRPAWVWVSPSLQTYRGAIDVNPDVRLFPQAGSTDAGRDYDLIITDNPDEPKGVTAPVSLHVGYVPKDLEDLIQLKPEPTTVISWHRTNPLLEHVELTDLVILDQAVTAQGLKEGDLENRRYEVIAYGKHGPLALHKREGQKQSFYLLFHTDRSTMPYRVGFPIMVSNTVREAMLAAGLLEVAGDRTGVLPALSLTPAQAYRVRGPAGFDRTEKADTAGTLSGVPAPRVGQYTLSKGDGEAKLGVSLLQPTETLLDTVRQIQFSEMSVTATANVPETPKQLWWLFALMAMAFLLIEWWFFQRRPGGFSK